MTTATVGTGTITLGSAVSGYLSFALSGVADGDLVSYAINDGTNSEIGTGTYTLSGTTLTRAVTKSTNSNTAISLSGTAQVFITARAEDILNAANPLTSPQVAVKSDQTTATSTAVAVTPAVQQNHPSAVKAWASFFWNGTTVTKSDSYNIGTITRNATGDYTINFTTAFANSGYVMSGSASSSGAANVQAVVNWASASLSSGPTLKSTTQARILTGNASSGIALDFGEANVVFYGTQ